MGGGVLAHGAGHVAMTGKRQPPNCSEERVARESGSFVVGARGARPVAAIVEDVGAKAAAIDEANCRGQDRIGWRPSM